MTEFLGYCRQRLGDDPHPWSTTLFHEVVGLGFAGSYQAFTASDAPPHWGFGDTAHLLIGVLPHSSRWRRWLAEAEDQPYLIEVLHQVSIGLGGLPRPWRFDRMATVCHPGSGRITASFGAVALLSLASLMGPPDCHELGTTAEAC